MRTLMLLQPTAAPLKMVCSVSFVLLSLGTTLSFAQTSADSHAQHATSDPTDQNKKLGQNKQLMDQITLLPAEQGVYKSELQLKVDYLYCITCDLHIPYIRLEASVWEVQCPRCVGQCGRCSCKTAGRCLGQGNLLYTHAQVSRRPVKRRL